ncbi:MAG: flagellar motor switch protein FliN [Dehalococcoidia bacterium]
MSNSTSEIAEDDWADALAEQAEMSAATAVPATMPKLEAEGPTEGSAGLEHILEISVTLSVEIGTTNVSIRNLLQFNQGSVVELDRLAGEPLDVLINGTLIAHGEVVVVNEKFGIRLTDVVSAHERVRNLV